MLHQGHGTRVLSAPWGQRFACASNHLFPGLLMHVEIKWLLKNFGVLQVQALQAHHRHGQRGCFVHVPWRSSPIAPMCVCVAAPFCSTNYLLRLFYLLDGLASRQWQSVVNESVKMELWSMFWSTESGAAAQSLRTGCAPLVHPSMNQPVRTNHGNMLWCCDSEPVQ